MIQIWSPSLYSTLLDPHAPWTPMPSHTHTTYTPGKLADPGGSREPGTLAPRFGCPSVQFKSNTMNFRDRYFIFFSKNVLPHFTQHEFYISFTFFWSYSAHYFIYIQSSHRHWKTWNTWKNETTFSSQGTVREYLINQELKYYWIFPLKLFQNSPFLGSVKATPFQGQTQSVLNIELFEFHESIFGLSK